MMDEHWHKGLTERQRRFCEAYAAAGNATEAARRAGYRRPDPQGAENLRKPAIAHALEALRQETTAAAIAEREERQAWWTSIMRGEHRPDGSVPTISEQLRASELLGRAQGDFVERREITGRDGGAFGPSVLLGYMGSTH
ncbi:terminase small subunit [Halorhodospira neutriphila]|uniref:Terminase small subunit n=1 Tax=Halorhodospira neutriphila TaxID=168379 RepID=A0ABS1E1Z6_9GAMM|nr:terminase small subunit [Halorhodospira neutriphila]MBK1725731.1 hypothetical protein [Halorhodospira neutriphila]